LKTHPSSKGSADPRVHTLILVSAPGLYGLITTSHKPSARKFKRWVNHEVLPSIARTGGYTAGRPEEPRDVRLARGLVEAHGVIAEHRGQVAVLTVEKAEEREGRLKAEALAAELAAENAAQAAPARRRATPPDALDRASTTRNCTFWRGGVTRKTPPDPTSISH
jgi:prophage antirepressor-like protein